jgi:serine/threonine protein kinase
MEEIFEAALQLRDPERTKFVREACGADVELADELESMLAVDEGAGELLHGAVQQEAEFLSSDQMATFVGTTIGLYRITGLLGSGGMGTVYLAIRLDGLYERPVALKLLKRGMDSDDVISRFQRERRILSRLDHPNIARLLDGGATQEGLPYLVMEHVEGEPIVRHVQNLPLRKRLELFRDVCGAVDYAHRSLVVHRDLKPGNILVTYGGTPKLLDFGIAKVLTPEETGETIAGYRLLTPQYASPEQKRGEPVTIASDVYSLGRILEEILEPAHLAGELSQIAQMACRDEPEQRYRSVAQFSEDLCRYLDGRPILARGDSVYYRARKFVRRNKLAVAASVVSAASLVGALLVSTTRAKQSREEVEQTRSLAHAMLFQMNEEIRRLPGSVEARENLVRTALPYLEAAGRKIGSDPRVDWELAQSFALIASLQGGPEEDQSNLGDVAGARRSFEAALRLTNELVAQEPANEEFRAFEAKLRHNLGRLAEDPQEANTELQESIRISKELRDGNSVEHARLGLALIDLGAGNPRAALELLPRKTDRHTWAMKVQALKAGGDLAGALAEARRGAEIAEGDLASARQAATRRFAERAAAAAHTYIGEILGAPFDLNLGDRAEAIRELRLATSYAEENAALEPRDAVVLSDLAATLIKLAAAIGDRSPAESVASYERAIIAGSGPRMRDLLRAEMQQVVVDAQWQIVYPLVKLGLVDEAFRNVRKSIELKQTSGGHIALGDLLTRTGDLSGALRHYQQALELARAEAASRPYMMPLRQHEAEASERIARWHEATHDSSGAALWWEKSLAIWKDWSKAGVSSAFNDVREQLARGALARVSSPRTQMQPDARRDAHSERN